MPHLSILIISYNTRAMTLACLESLYAQTKDVSLETIVVDNASTDGSAQAIAEKFPQARLLALSENLGFAGGNNLAAEYATGDYLLLLNPDTVVLDRAVDRLFAFAQAHPEAQIFGGKTLFADGSLNPASCWRRPTLWNVGCIAFGLASVFPRSGLFHSECYGGWPRDTARRVDMVSGCFFLLKRALWEELGGFDPAFFMYGEEADLCLRAARKGARCMITPDATVIHHGGASEAVRADKMVKLFTAKAHLFRRHWNPVAAWIGMRLLDFWAFSRMSAFAFLRRIQARRRASFDTWRAIWARRREWHVAAPASPNRVAPPTAVSSPAAPPRPLPGNVT